ncbi:MAG: HD domain-containing phosphohydrolase [Acidaminobacteraceae bacterium]
MESRILLIDDSPIDRKIIKMTLKKRLLGIEVYELDNGFDVIDKIKEHNISMCIVDILMPKKDGFQLLEEIKRDPDVKDIPVIICTGIKDNNAIERALELGAYDYFSKPFSEEVLKISLPLKVKNAIQLSKRNDEIKHLSSHDVLTGSYSRRFYEEEIRRLDIYDNLPMTLIMGDVNGLKLINDTFGYSVGDEVLIKVTEVIKKNCQSRDIVTRWGGDEFLILLPNTEASKAEKLVARIQSELLTEYIHSLKISVSFGLSTKVLESTSIGRILKNCEEFMYKNKMMVKESARSQIIATMIKTLNEKNPREEGHSRRVSQICTILGREMNLTEFEINNLKMGGLLHDIGKIALGEEVLNKAGELTSAEWEVIKRHPSIGYRILSESEDTRDIAELALSHHEKWDGSGYPRGISGENTPLLARIVAVADAYDAMTGERTYRSPLSHSDAVEELRRCSGTQFDPGIIEAFLLCGMNLSQLEL